MENQFDHPEIILDKMALDTIKSIMTSDIQLAQAVNHNRIDHTTYQILLALRGLNAFLKTHRITPQFSIDLEEFGRVGGVDNETEL